MKIKLNEISENGQNYQYDHVTAELSNSLSDLINNNPYNVEFSIRPLNTKDYTLNGTIKTEAQEQCSRCGENFLMPISKKLNEILIPVQIADRNEKYAKSPLKLDTDSENINVSEYTHEQFDLGEFVHEAIAIELPFAPRCELCQKKGDEVFIYDEKMGEEEKPSPFKALKGLKLN